MNRSSVDVAVIGAGSAGLTAFRAAQRHGKRVVLIEGGPGGTTCARVGCMPSKLLIAAAEAAHRAAEAPVFGVRIAEVGIDGHAVMARVQAERNRFVSFVFESVNAIPAGLRLAGQARFLAPQQLQVGDDTVVEARSIVIATGSRPVIPKVFQDLGDRLATSDTVFEWASLPASVAVIGTGTIGLELGQALHRLGVRVTLYGRDRQLAQISDPAVAQVAAGYMESDLDLRLQTNILKAERDAEAVTLHSRNAAGEHRQDRFEHVLVAAGRLPNLDSLDLDKAGLALDSHGIPQHDPHTLQCGETSIFIAGDASAERPVLHEATSQGRIAGDNAARYPDLQMANRLVPFSITFTDPQIASAGPPFQLLAAGNPAVGEVRFEDQGRSRVMNRNRGILRIYAGRASGRVLAAEMFGPDAEHLMHLLAWAVQQQMRVEDMLAMPFYHPVVEEGIRTALKALADQIAPKRAEAARCADCTPGV